MPCILKVIQENERAQHEYTLAIILKMVILVYYVHRHTCIQNHNIEIKVNVTKSEKKALRAHFCILQKIRKCDETRHF